MRTDSQQTTEKQQFFKQVFNRNVFSPPREVFPFSFHCQPQMIIESNHFQSLSLPTFQSSSISPLEDVPSTCEGWNQSTIEQQRA